MLKIDGFRLPSFLLLLLIMTSSQADWATITPEELEQQSDLIIVGELIDEKIIHHPSIDSEIKVGVIKRDETLKGKNQSETILLRLPLLKAGMVLSSSDVTFTIGQTGLWYLEEIGTDLFIADRPDRFVPQDLATDLISNLRCQKE